MAALAAYFKARGIGSFIWWAWNADAGDTGGIPANDSYFWRQGGPDDVHRVLPNNGVPWTDVRAPAPFDAAQASLFLPAASCTSCSRCRAQVRPAVAAASRRSSCVHAYQPSRGGEACLMACAAVQINWDKIMWMEQAFGLKPWYLQGGSGAAPAPATPAPQPKPPVATE